MTAKEYLNQYRTLNARIDAKIAQAERLRYLARTPGAQRPSNDIHSTAPHDKIGELTAKIFDLEREINSEIDSLVDLEREIRGCIARVPKENQRLVLELKYINGETLVRIADRLHYSLDGVKKIHKLALESVHPITPFAVI